MLTHPDTSPAVLKLIRDASGNGSRIAIVEPTVRSMTYAELLARVGVIRANLRASLQLGSRVGLCLPRGINHICSLLGVMDAGCVAVLIDPASPPKRMQAMLSDAGVSAVLVDSGQPSINLGAWASKALFVDDLSPMPDRGSACTDAAYIVFTSGSTGRPKGVLVGHAGLVEHTTACITRFQMTSEDVTVQFASPGFDVLIEEIFPTLCAGGCLVIRPDELWTPDEFVEFLTLHRVTSLELPSGYWAALFWDPEIRASLCPNPELRFLNVGGEKTTLAALANWRDSAFGQIRLVNTYGPTEVVVSSNAYDVPSDLPIGIGDAVPLGPPLGARTMHILDPDNPLGPEVEIGELAVGGAIADEYVGRPDETSRAFIELASGERVYRTGDRVRWIELGNLEFLGRLDDQVKVRGFRVELGDVEAALVTIPHVYGVAAAPSPLGTALVAAVVLDIEENLPAVEAEVASLLPEYMIPRLKAVAELPKLANGKLDRAAVTALFTK